MNATRLIGLIGLALLSSLPARACDPCHTYCAPAAYNDAPRQYYSPWYHAAGLYYYRYYYYKPTPTYVGYQHYYVLYYPQYGPCLYYYNPYTHCYCGRCTVPAVGNPVFAQLSSSAQQGNLAAIPATAFQVTGKPPLIPGSQDGVPLQLPPADLPKAPLPSAPSAVVVAPRSSQQPALAQPGR